jgi:hypothetical protein
MASVTAIREKDWVFHALWAACGPGVMLKCSVIIPVTVLFKNGAPYKGMDYFGSNLRRISLDEHYDNVRDGRRIISGSSSALLRVCRSLLLNFAKEYGYVSGNDGYSDDFNGNVEDGIDESTTICSVVYVDGEREDITLRQYDVLIRNESWRKQILFVQGFVPATSKQSGFFGNKKKVGSNYVVYFILITVTRCFRFVHYLILTVRRLQTNILAPLPSLLSAPTSNALKT